MAEPMGTLSRLGWLDFFQHYKGLPHQKEALLLLRGAIMDADLALMNTTAPWADLYRHGGRVDAENSWDGVAAAAARAGARFPELVAAQWALESDWGKSPSGVHNYFGLKGVKGQGVKLPTNEEVGGKMQEEEHYFMSFQSLEGCVEHLVSRWYLDWKHYKGVNNCSSAELAAHQLQKEGYATDSKYAEKLIRVMMNHAEPGVAPARKPAHPFLKPGDHHLVVNDLVESVKAYDHTGRLLWEKPALARGQGAENEWDAVGTDTPPGLWKLGKVYRDFETAGGTSAAFSPDRRSYGWYSFEMIPLEKQDTTFNRAGIMLHGGGTACGWPGAWASFQALHPTLGCVRMHNSDLKEYVLPLAEKGTVFVTVFQED